MKTLKISFILAVFLTFFIHFSAFSQDNNIEINTPETTDVPLEAPAEILIEGTNNDDEISITLVEKAMAEAPLDKTTKKALTEAEDSYKKAIDAFKKGNSKKAKKHFSAFLSKLENADIDPGIYFFLFDDFNSINSKLKKIYEIDSKSPTIDFTSSSIPLECEDNSEIERYISIYSGSYKKPIRAAFERSGAYKEMILKTLKEYNLPQELVWLPVVESQFSNNDVSHAGAVGLWQIMEHRGRALGLHINYWIDERRDPEKATRAACLYLKQLYLMLNDWHLVLAGYNRGEYGLIRDMKFSNATNINEMAKRNAVPKETQKYVPQFIAAVTIANDLEKYGFTDLNYATPAKYDTIKTDKIIDLKIVAQCAETTLEEIKNLNPALKAWCTPHGYPGFELKIPLGSKEKFLENIAKVENLNPSPGYIKYKVVKGDYLEKIAKSYRTTVSDIKKDNPQLAKSKYLKVGAVLTIRPGRAYYK